MYPLSCFSTCSESKEDGEGASYWAETSETSAPFLFLAVFTAPSTLAEGRLQEGHLAEEGGSSQDPLFPGRLCLFGTTHFVVCVPLPLHESSYIRCLVPCCLCVVPLIFKIMLLGSLGNRASELIDDLVPNIVKLGCNPGCISEFLACSTRGQDCLLFLRPEGQTLPPFLTLPLRSWSLARSLNLWGSDPINKRRQPVPHLWFIICTNTTVSITQYFHHRIRTELELMALKANKDTNKNTLYPPPLQVFISVLLEKLWCHKCLLQAFRSSTWISIWQGSPLLLLLFSFRMKRKV